MIEKEPTVAQTTIIVNRLEDCPFFDVATWNEFKLGLCKHPALKNEVWQHRRCLPAYCPLECGKKLWGITHE